MKINKNNYFEQIAKLDFKTLPLVIKQAHTVIMLKTDNGREWSFYNSNADFKRMTDLAFQKMEEFINSKNKKGLSGKSNSKPSKDYSSIKKEMVFIHRFLDFHDKVLYKKTFEIFINELQEAIKKKEITKKSPVAKDIMAMQEACIAAFNSMKNAKHFVLKPATIKRLKGIIEKYENAYDDLDENYLKEKKKSVSLEGLNNPGQIMCSIDFEKLQFDTIGFTGKWLDLIGDPSPGFTAMVFGLPKMGKSYLCVDFAGYLARNHGKVIYVAKEEKLDRTLQDKLKHKDVAHPNLFVSDHLPTSLTEYDFIFLDSVTKLGLLPEDLDKLKKENKGKSFVFVFQTTKEGKFRGTNAFQHDVDVVIEVPELGKAVQFGRFNQGGKLNIFPDSAPDSLTLEENVSMLAGINKKPMKKKAKDWTEPAFLSKNDHDDLKFVKELYEQGKLTFALRYAQNLDTIVREEIPAAVWKEIGGDLTPKGEEELKNQQLHKLENLKKAHRIYTERYHNAERGSSEKSIAFKRKTDTGEDIKRLEAALADYPNKDTFENAIENVDADIENLMEDFEAGKLTEVEFDAKLTRLKTHKASLKESQKTEKRKLK